jgi:trehalose 6-phosphate phosphatase
MGTANPGRRRRRTDGSLATGDRREADGALALAQAVLATAPAGLVTDLDGTLAPIVPIPSAARPVQGAAEALGELASRLAIVAVITGRAAVDARRILGDVGERVLVVGNHGLEWLEPGADSPSSDEGLGPVREVLGGLLARVPRIAGVTVEDKGFSATIHYRRARDPDAARAALLTALTGSDPAGLEIREGRRSIELRPAGRGDKGTALRAVVERHGLRGLLVAGDDATDLDMFLAARDLRSGGLRSTIFAISGGREVPDAVQEAADAILPDPGAFASLLTGLADATR